MRQIFRAKTKKIGLSLLVGVMMFSLANAFDDDLDTIPEIGEVKWSLDLESAKHESKKTGRPLFLLFQEIPG